MTLYVLFLNLKEIISVISQPSIKRITTMQCLFQNAKRLISMCLVTLLIVTSALTISPAPARAGDTNVGVIIICEKGSDCANTAAFAAGVASGSVVTLLATGAAVGSAATAAATGTIAAAGAAVGSAAAAATGTIAAAGAAVGSALAAPVVVPLVATAAVGYIGYQAWQAYQPVQAKPSK